MPHTRSLVRKQITSVCGGPLGGPIGFWEPLWVSGSLEGSHSLVNPRGAAAQARLGSVTFPSSKFADTDNILTNKQTLRLLIEQGLPVAAPMLDSQTYYSNFWCGITPQVRPGRGPQETWGCGRKDTDSRELGGLGVCVLRQGAGFLG